MFPDNKTNCVSHNSSHNFSNLYKVLLQAPFAIRKQNLISSKTNFMYKVSLVESKEIGKFSETLKSE